MEEVRAERNREAIAVASSAAAAAQQLNLLLSAGHQPNSTQHQSELLLGEESAAHRRRVVMEAAAAAGLPASLQAASAVVDSDLATLTSAIAAACGLGVSQGTATGAALQEDVAVGTAAPSASEASEPAAYQPHEEIGSPEAVMDRQPASADLKPAAARRLQFGREGGSSHSVPESTAAPGTVTAVAASGIKGELADDKGHHTAGTEAEADAEAESKAVTALGRQKSPPLQQLELPVLNSPTQSREHLESSVNDVEAVLEVAIIAPLLAQHRCLGRACCR